MGRELLTNLVFGGNQAVEMVLEHSASPPSSPSEGQVYYNTGDRVAYYWDGFSWVPMAGISDNDFLDVGSASLTVVSEVAWGRAADAGNATNLTYSRGDHTHGSPPDPRVPQFSFESSDTLWAKVAELPIAAQGQYWSLTFDLLEENVLTTARGKLAVEVNQISALSSLPVVRAHILYETKAPFPVQDPFEFRVVVQTISPLVVEIWGRVPTATGSTVYGRLRDVHVQGGGSTPEDLTFYKPATLEAFPSPTLLDTPADLAAGKFAWVHLSNDPVLSTDAARKQYVDSEVSTAQAAAQSYADSQDASHSADDRAYADAQDDAHSTADRSYADTQDDAHSTADRQYTDDQDAAHVADADPHVQYLKEVDHTKAAHDALLIDAATLDGLDSTSFLRSDSNDDVDGTLTFNALPNTFLAPTIFSHLTNKQYVDDEVSSARSYADSQDASHSTADRAYTDAEIATQSAADRVYTDQAEADAKAYADSQDDSHSTADRAYTDSEIASQSALDRAYTDQAEADAKAHADAQDDAHSTADRQYADDQDDAHSTADRAYTDTADAAHVAATDPHGDRAYADTADAAHVAAGDPHPQYQTQAESDARYLGITAKAADSDLLDGLDSTQFLRSDVADTATATTDFSAGLTVSGDATGTGETNASNLYITGESAQIGMNDPDSGSRFWMHLNNDTFHLLQNDAADGTTWLSLHPLQINLTSKTFDVYGGDLVVAADTSVTVGQPLTANSTVVLNNSLMVDNGNGGDTWLNHLDGGSNYITHDGLTRFRQSDGTTNTTVMDISGTTDVLLPNDLTNLVLGASPASGDRLRLHRNSGTSYVDYASGSLHFRADGSTFAATLTNEGVFSARVRLDTPKAKIGDAGLPYMYKAAASVTEFTGFVSGAIVLNTGRPPSSSMSIYRIYGYVYDPDNHIDIRVGGYDSPAPAFQNTGYINFGPQRPSQVRFGRDASGNVVVIIGDITDLWWYPQIMADIFHGYSGTQSSFDNASISFVTDLTGYDTLTPVSEKKLDAFVRDSDLLDGLEGTQFLRSDVNDTMSGLLTATGYIALSTSGGSSDTSARLFFRDPSNSQDVELVHNPFDGELPEAGYGLWIKSDPAGANNQDATLTVEGNIYANNTQRVLTTADEGSGNGIDADTVDGLQASQFLRSDASDTYTGTNLSFSAASKINFGSDTRQMIDLWDTSYGVGVQNNTAYIRTDGRFSVHLAGTHHDLENNPGTGGTNLFSVTTSEITYKTNTIWHSGNDGAGSGLDADTVDGVHSGSFLRSNTSDAFTSGTLTFNSGTTLDADAASAVRVPTETAGDSSTKAASTAFVQTAVSNAVATAGSGLDAAEKLTLFIL